jgi:pimeloyl-ACP methyl ester carboxylesterase
MSPAYEQPQNGECAKWCDPRQGSDAAFRQALADLGAQSGHPELASAPWVLWGHSGGGTWAGAMALLHPQRVAAAWLRSGVPPVKTARFPEAWNPLAVPPAALAIPLMCNLGTAEGVTVKDNPFAQVWPVNEAFFEELRARGALIGVAIDPKTSHECGNQRYLAIPWLDACLTARLPKKPGDPLAPMPTAPAWLAELHADEAAPATTFKGKGEQAIWLPNESIARAWMQYVRDTAVEDTTPPPAPKNFRVQGNVLTWEAEADLESGLAGFIIERDGQIVAKLPEKPVNRFGRPIFQGLQYSDTPTQPLGAMTFTDATAEPGRRHAYRISALNSLGMKSESSANSRD